MSNERRYVFSTVNKASARDAFHRAWVQHRLAGFAGDRGFDAQVACERVMDAVQVDCVDDGKPGAEWDAFVATLPGYCEYWEQLVGESQVRPR